MFNPFINITRVLLIYHGFSSFIFQTWNMIRDHVNDGYHMARTIKAFKSKWKVLMAEVKKQKDHNLGTGGGPMMRESPLTAVVLLILGEESDAVNGIR